MQDFILPCQYKVIQNPIRVEKHPWRRPSQSVNPYGSSTADKDSEAFATGEIMKPLQKAIVLPLRSPVLHTKIQPNNELGTDYETWGTIPKILLQYSKIQKKRSKVLRI